MSPGCRRRWHGRRRPPPLRTPPCHDGSCCSGHCPGGHCGARESHDALRGCGGPSHHSCKGVKRGYPKWRRRVPLCCPQLMGRPRGSLEEFSFWRASSRVCTWLKTRPRQKSRVCLIGRPMWTGYRRKLRGNVDNWSRSLPFCKLGVLSYGRP
jgi:hypothetical protein